MKVKHQCNKVPKRPGAGHEGRVRPGVVKHPRAGKKVEYVSRPKNQINPTNHHFM